MLSKYKRQQAEATIRNLGSDIMCNLRAEYNCSLNADKERNREAHFNRLMGKLDLLRTMDVITFNQQMLLMEYYMETRREDLKKSA